MNDDISGLLFRIKENIKAIENGDTSDLLLDEVRSDFLDMIELMKLFLISERDSYYGYFLMNMQFKTDFYSDSIAGIKLNTFPPVFEANPLLLCRFRLKEILYIMCHEIDHVVLNHPAEMVRINPERDPDKFYKFNLAADAAVNDRIDYEIKEENHHYLSRPDGVITSDVLSKMYNLGRIRSMENYAYYYNLLQEKDKKPDSIHSSGNIWGHNWKAGDDEEDASAVVRELVNAAVGMMNEESRGLMPAGFMSCVKKLNEPPVLSWQKILKKYVGTITANKRKTRMRLNRRQPYRFDLSGTMDDKVLKIVVAIDTSASVDDSMIAKIFNEIFAIIAKRKHDITVIECDAQVQRVYKVMTHTDIKEKVAGRGGTLFSPVIEYVNNDKYFRDALLIYFTDGYGESEIPKPRTYRNMWVVIGDARHLSVKEPYGAVLSL